MDSGKWKKGYKYKNITKRRHRILSLYSSAHMHQASLPATHPKPNAWILGHVIAMKHMNVYNWHDDLQVHAKRPAFEQVCCAFNGMTNSLQIMR